MQNWLVKRKKHSVRVTPKFKNIKFIRGKCRVLSSVPAVILKPAQHDSTPKPGFIKSKLSTTQLWRRVHSWLILKLSAVDAQRKHRRQIWNIEVFVRDRTLCCSNGKIFSIYLIHRNVARMNGCQGNIDPLRWEQFSPPKKQKLKIHLNSRFLY